VVDAIAFDAEMVDKDGNDTVPIKSREKYGRRVVEDETEKERPLRKDEADRDPLYDLINKGFNSALIV